MIFREEKGIGMLLSLKFHVSYFFAIGLSRLLLACLLCRTSLLTDPIRLIENEHVLQ